MKIKKIKSLLIAVCISLTAIPSFAFAEKTNVPAEPIIRTVNFIDFDGNIMATQKIPDGECIDYNAVDTSVLYERFDYFKERKFYSWNILPITATEDMDIQALYQQVTLYTVGVPEKTVYNAYYSAVTVKGLTVNIKVESQTAQRGTDGKFIVDEKIVNITNACQWSFERIDDRFGELEFDVEKQFEMNIYPPGYDRAIYTYTITAMFPHLDGDVNADAAVDAADAGLILTHYAAVSAKEKGVLTEKQAEIADVNGDGVVDALDASEVLQIYAVNSTSN